MSHRGPLPLRELHSTNETLAWRDPGDLEPVYDLFTEDRKAKEQARAEKGKKWTDPSSANCSEDKSWVEDGPGKERETVALRREKGALHKRKQSY